MSDFFDKIKKVHLIGIGGIGVSALARKFIHNGKEVSGSDSAESSITDNLKMLGACIRIGHDEKNFIDDTDVVIYSPAVSNNNPELVEARRMGVKTYSYPEALGIISEDKYTIAVSGTHGKTTTTAMIAEILIENNKEPTVVAGSIMGKTRSNFVYGNSEIFVVEACEFKRSFLQLNPDILVITNIDEDHLDYYKDIDDIISAFAEMARKVPDDGYIVCNPKDKNTKIAIEGARAKVVDYMKEEIEAPLPVFGTYNILNARAAISSALLVGVRREDAENALGNFHGTQRRQEYIGRARGGALVYDDYAHHPTEIRNTLAGFRQKFLHKKITVVFQPHLYSRTKLLLKDFAKSFGDADKVIIADIYAARETDDGSIKSDDMVKHIKEYQENAEYIGGFDEIAEHLRVNLSDDDVFITMGAGDIWKIGRKLI